MPTKRRSTYGLTASVIIAAVFTVFDNGEAQAQRRGGAKSSSTGRAAAPTRAAPSRAAPTRAAPSRMTSPAHTSKPSRAAGVTRPAPANRSVSRPTRAQMSPATARPTASPSAPRLASPSPRTVSRPTGPSRYTPPANSSRPAAPRPSASSSVAITPGLSRAPLVRAPQPAATDLARVRDHATAFPPISAPYAVGSTVFPTISSPYAVSDARNYGRNDFGRSIRIGTDPLRLSYGDPRQRYYRPNYGNHHAGHYYNGYRPLCYSRYPYSYYGYGYYPSFGYGYAYSTVYLTEPYIAQSTYSPQYAESSYVPAEYATTDQYTAPPAQALPPQQEATEPLPPGTADTYQTLDPVEQQRTIVGDANTAFAAGRYEEAKGLYIRAVLTDERDGLAKMLYAWANFALGDYDTAAASLRRALWTTTDLVDNPMDLRTLYSDRSALTLQTERLERFVAENPVTREPELVLAYLYYSIGEADRAASMFGGLADRDAEDTLAAQLRAAAVRNSRGSSPPPDAP